MYLSSPACCLLLIHKEGYELLANVYEELLSVHSPSPKSQLQLSAFVTSSLHSASSAFKALAGGIELTFDKADSLDSNAVVWPFYFFFFLVLSSALDFKTHSESEVMQTSSEQVASNGPPVDEVCWKLKARSDAARQLLLFTVSHGDTRKTTGRRYSWKPSA